MLIIALQIFEVFLHVLKIFYLQLSIVVVNLINFLNLNMFTLILLALVLQSKLNPSNHLSQLRKQSPDTALLSKTETAPI